MEKVYKEQYEAPQTEVFTVVPEGIVCGSDPNQSKRMDYDWEQW